MASHLNIMLDRECKTAYIIN